MKKSLALILSLVLLPLFALADLPDLSGLSFDELIALREQVNLALWASDGWQEVTVPAGVYQVGKDIPAGYWHICVKPYNFTQIYYCENLDISGASADFLNGYYYTIVLTDLSDSDPVTCDIDMKDGMYFIADSNSVIFSPYTGKPDLGFK